MTRSDPEQPDREQGNPFDTGLPMLRLPAQQPKRKRGPGRRATGRRRSPITEPPVPQADPAPVAPPPRRLGEWEDWLDPPSPVDPQPAESNRPPVREPAAEPVEDTVARVPAIIDRSGGNPGPALRRPVRQREQQRGGGNRLFAVLIVLGLGIAVVSVLTFVFGGSSERAPAAATTPKPVPGSAVRSSVVPAPGDQSTAIATPGCEQRRTGEVISGTDPGGTSDGPSAILAFERAYYVQRSGFAARGVVAEDATVPAAEQIQRGINQVPAGTLYCVQITHASSDAGQVNWEVQLTQQRPGDQAQTFTQIISTRTAGNRTLITAINAG